MELMEMGSNPDCEMNWEESWENLFTSETGHDSLTLEETMKLQVFPDVGEIAKFARLAYVERQNILNFLDGTHPDLIKEKRDTFTDWKLICTGSGKTSSNSYIGAAFYRHGTNGRHSQLIIAHRGTKQFEDWEANADGIVKNLVTRHLVSACIFAQNVTKSVIQKSNWHVSTIITGHSLGGWLAQATALTVKYMELPGEDISTWKPISPPRCHPHCAAFDSPGAQPVLKYLNETYKICEWTKMKLDITNYVYQTNLVNTLNEHLFDLIRIAKKNFRVQPPPNFDSTRDKISHILYTGQVHELQLFLELFGSKFESNQNSYGNTEKLQLHRITNWPLTSYPTTTRENVLKKFRGTFRKVWLYLGIPFSMLRYRGLDAYIKELAGKDAGLGKANPVEFPSLNWKSLSDKEKTLFKILMNLSGHLTHVDSNTKRLIPILFKEFSPLIDLDSLNLKMEKIEVDKIEVEKIVVEKRLQFTEEVDILHFRNAALMDNVNIDVDLLKWAVDSEKRYSDFFKEHGSPDFSNCITLPNGSSHITSTSEQADILLLNLVSNIMNNNSNQVLLLYPRTEEEIRSLRNIQDGCHIILDCDTIIPDFNFTGNITYLRIDEQSALHDFTLDSETIGRIMNTEINIDGKITNLSELGIDSGRLVKFLKTHPADLQKILQSLDKKQIMIGPFAKSIFDSDFVYMQIGEKYSLEELKTYYQDDNLTQSHKVFAGNNDQLKAVLQTVQIPQSSCRIVDTKSCFESFKEICKSQRDSTVDLWEFDGLHFTHSYQYNKDFYVDRFIQQPVVDDLELCDILGNLHKIKAATVDGYSAKLDDKMFTKKERLVLHEDKIEFYDNKGDSTSVLLKNIKELKFYKKVNDLKLEITKLTGDKLNFFYDSFTTVKDTEALEVENKRLILSDEPGMGKSTALLKRLPILRQSSRLLAFIELKSFELVDADAVNDPEFLEKFIAVVSKKLLLDNLSKFVFNEMATKSELGRVLMVFDGFDEIGNLSKKTFLKWLAIVKDIPSIRIIVSTRPHDREDLENCLQTRAHKFLAIEEKDRAEFLAQNWRQILRTNSNELMYFAEKVISTVHSPLVRTREEFLGVPLQLRILTEIFLKPLKEYLASIFEGMSLEREIKIKDFIDKDWTLAKIYHKYIERRLTIYLQEKLGYHGDREHLQTILSNTINPPLYILAGKFIFSGSEAQTPDESNLLSEWFGKVVTLMNLRHNYVRVTEEFFPLLLKTGLLYGNQTKPDFLHKTFAEYYIAKCLVEVVLLENLSSTYFPSPPELGQSAIKILVSDFILKSSGGVVQRFFNEMLEENVNLKTKILSFQLSGLVASYDKKILKHLSGRESIKKTFLTFCINLWSNHDLIRFLNEIELNPLILAIDHVINKGLFLMVRKLYQCTESRDAPVFTLFISTDNKQNVSMNTLSKIQSWLKSDSDKFLIEPFQTETRKEFVKNRPLLSAVLLSGEFELEKALINGEDLKNQTIDVITKLAMSSHSDSEKYDDLIMLLTRGLLDFGYYVHHEAFQIELHHLRDKLWKHTRNYLD